MKETFDVDRFMDKFTEDRILALNDTENDDVVCPNCGSRHYEELILKRGKPIGCTDCE